MGRQRIAMEDGSTLIIGYDRGSLPSPTWFAMHHDPGSSEDDAPRVAIGYSPDEQALLQAERPDAVIGPYPVVEFEDLVPLIERLMGIPRAPEQPPCWSCGKPPFRPNPDCTRHPYENLKGG